MWKIIIGEFATKEEAEAWIGRNVKKQDWHPAKVEEVTEEFPEPGDRPSPQKKS